MNAKELYLAVGKMDDGLILEADEAPARRELSAWRRWAPLAACLILVLAAAFFARGREQIQFNELHEPPAVGMKIQGEASFLHYEEAMDHYGLTLPETLAGLSRGDRDLFAVYHTEDGAVTYDENRVTYGSGERTVAVTLAKRGSFSAAHNDGVKWSKVNGVDVMLAATGAENPNAANYWAEFEAGDTRVQVFSYGLDRDEFLEAVRELI